MTKEDIIRLAQESKLYSGKPRTPATGRMIEKRLKRFAALVAAAEREACAELAERMDFHSALTGFLVSPDQIAAAIRARGESK